MNRELIISKVIEIVKPYARNSEKLLTINPETKILEELQINSARLVDIIISIEDEFNIEVEDEAASKIVTVGDAIKYIESKI